MRRGFRKQNALFYVIVGLIAIGVLSMIASNPAGAVVPVAVFGIVFLLYKFPPHKWKAFASRAQRLEPKRRGKPDPRAERRAKFRVIPGSKRDDDNIPKYH